MNLNNLVDVKDINLFDEFKEYSRISAASTIALDDVPLEVWERFLASQPSGFNSTSGILNSLELKYLEGDKGYMLLQKHLKDDNKHAIHLIDTNSTMVLGHMGVINTCNPEINESVECFNYTHVMIRGGGYGSRRLRTSNILSHKIFGTTTIYSQADPELELCGAWNSLVSNDYAFFDKDKKRYYLIPFSTR